MTWPADGSAGSGLTRTPTLQDIEQVENQILQLAPATDAQRWFKGEALKLSEEVSKSRWRILNSQGGSVPLVFLVVVISWLAVTFTSFGLYLPVERFGPRRYLFVAAISVAAAVFLILELDGPFEGLIKISSFPLRFTLSQLGQ